MYSITFNSPVSITFKKFVCLKLRVFCLGFLIVFNNEDILETKDTGEGRGGGPCTKGFKQRYRRLLHLSAAKSEKSKRLNYLARFELFA